MIRLVIAFRRMLLAVAMLLAAYPVRAGDEEMMNPYTRLDPETGFFVPIDELPDDQQATGTAVENDIPVKDWDGQSSSLIVNPSSASTSSLSQSLLILGGIGFIVVLAGGLIVWLRKPRQQT